MGISFKPENFTEGGGFCPEGEYQIIGAKFNFWDNDGKNGMTKRVYAHFDLQPGSGGAKFKPSGEAIFQRYGVGDPKFYVPSKTGKAGDVADEGPFVIAAPTDEGKDQLSKQCNYYTLIASAYEAGMEFDEDLSALVGSVVYMHHIAQKEREGIKSLNDDGAEGGEAKKDRVRTLPVIKKLLAKPNEVKVQGAGATPAAKPAAAAAGTATPAAAAKKEAAAPAAEGEVNDALAEVLMEVLDGNIQRGKARVAMFKVAKEREDSKAINTAFGDDAVLSATLASIGYTLNGDSIEQQ
jgi:hypothetical protein